MDQVHVIRHAVLVQGRSVRSVARELGISRNTVKKYLSVTEPLRIETAARARPVYEKVRKRLGELLDDWSSRTTKKQRITGSRLHRQVIEEDFQVGVTLVRAHLREWRRLKREVYIPLVHRAGDEAQIDFFEVTVELERVRRKAFLFLMRLMYSGRDFVWLYDRCDQISFLDGHVRAFAHLSGVPARCIYDNLKPAVVKVMMPERKLAARFLALSSHYLFEPCFARPGEGHDKGGVESRGKGVRLQHMVPIPRGESLEAISIELLRKVDEQAVRVRSREDGRTASERFAEEQSRLMPLPAHPFEARRAVAVALSRTSRARIEGAWYSVPSRWASLEAMAYIGVEDVVITCRGESVTRRRQRFGGRDIRYRDYLPELGRKPQAVRQVAEELVAELGKPFDRLWRLLVETHGEKEAARVLSSVLAAMAEHGEAAVRNAVIQALAVERTDLLGLSWVLVRPAPMEVEVPTPLSCYTIESARAADYDVLLIGGEA